MSVSITHAFISAIADGLDTTVVRPSNWNDTHTVTGLSASATTDTTTTANITDSTNKRFITDAQQTVVGNTSGINTGDQTTVSGNAGTATKWATARNLAGNSVDGSANVAFSNAFIVQGTADSGLSAAQFMGALGTGLVKNATTTGVQSIATAGTDYVAPGTATNFTAQQYFGATALTFSGTIAWNLNTAQAATITGTSNIPFTLSNPTNMQAGATYTLIITQFSTGGQVITWSSAYKFAGGSKFVLSTGNSAVDIITFISDGTNMYAVGQANFS